MPAQSRKHDIQISAQKNKGLGASGLSFAGSFILFFVEIERRAADTAGKKTVNDCIENEGSRGAFKAGECGLGKQTHRGTTRKKRVRKGRRKIKKIRPPNSLSNPIFPLAHTIDRPARWQYRDCKREEKSPLDAFFHFFPGRAKNRHSAVFALLLGC